MLSKRKTHWPWVHEGRTVARCFTRTRPAKRQQKFAGKPEEITCVNCRKVLCL